MLPSLGCSRMNVLNHPYSKKGLLPGLTRTRKSIFLQNRHPRSHLRQPFSDQLKWPKHVYRRRNCFFSTLNTGVFLQLYLTTGLNQKKASIYSNMLITDRVRQDEQPETQTILPFFQTKTYPMISNELRIHNAMIEFSRSYKRDSVGG